MQWTFLLAVLLRLVSQVQTKAVFAHFMVLAAKLPDVNHLCSLNFSIGRERRVLEPSKMGGRHSHCAGRTHWYVIKLCTVCSPFGLSREQNDRNLVPGPLPIRPHNRRWTTDTIGQMRSP